jgi:hypothetical protein
MIYDVLYKVLNIFSFFAYVLSTMDNNSSEKLIILIIKLANMSIWF